MTEALKFTITPALAAKLAAVAVHARESSSEDGRMEDLAALEQAAWDPEVIEWTKKMGPLAPVMRQAKPRRVPR